MSGRDDRTWLLLGDGSVFEGRRLGARGETIGEVVFNTGMTGYQEILTDPSYAGQIVLLTYPLVGNYGVNRDDFESDRLQPAGLIVREACSVPSNWRSLDTLDHFLETRGFVGIQGVDTRAITRRIRAAGVTMGMITCDDPDAAWERLRAAPPYDETDYVVRVSTRAPYAWGFEGREPIDRPERDYPYRIAVLDCGLKHNILRRFAALGARSIVLPALTPAEEILAWETDGLVLSPGPGDPARSTAVVETVRALLGRLPIFGICLGNQMLCRALGGRTYKLKFGHRGSNHPVKDLRDGTVTITSQNHGYAIDPDSLAGTGAIVSQVNLNDETVEGIEVPDLDAMAIQYHPEAAPGPWDSRKYFVQFIEKLAARKR